MKKRMQTRWAPPPLSLLRVVLSLALLASVTQAAGAQSHDHAAVTAPAAHPPSTAPATSPLTGQAAFATIAEVVARLEADPDTDWTRVDIEALCLHLVDMDRVLTLADVDAAPVSGGARFTVRGTGKTVGSIRRMTAAHARALEGDPELRLHVEPAEDGAIVTVTAAAGSAESVARIRGLGFAGLMVLDDHHGPTTGCSRPARHPRAIDEPTFRMIDSARLEGLGLFDGLAPAALKSSVG